MPQGGDRSGKKGERLEFSDIVRDLRALHQVKVRHRGEDYLLRAPLQSVCGKVLQAVGVAVPPPVRRG